MHVTAFALCLWSPAGNSQAKRRGRGYRHRITQIDSLVRKERLQDRDFGCIRCEPLEFSPNSTTQAPRAQTEHRSNRNDLAGAVKKDCASLNDSADHLLDRPAIDS